MNDISIYEKIPPLDKNFPVKVITSNGGKQLGMHWHEHIELLYFTNSLCEFNCGGKTFEAKEGDLVIVNSNEVHSFVAKADRALHICVIMYPSFFRDVNFERIVLKNLIRDDEFIKECILCMGREQDNATLGSDMLIKAKAYELMAYLVRNCAEERLSKFEYDIRRSRLKRVNDILSYIEEHYQESISTSELAKKFYLSESYLCRMFKKEIGVSPVAHINTLRVQKAEVLLKNTDESITSIAMNVGFSDVNYFSRIFKQIKGCTPKLFRNS